MAMILSYAIAIFSYQKTSDDEQLLNIGDILEVHRKADDGWWFGVKQRSTANDGSYGTAGWFPSNFVYEAHQNRVDIEMAKKIPPRIAVVIYDYQAMNPDELYLKKDELITILETIEDKGWLRGVVGNRHGIFPENFVRVMTRAEFENQGTVERPPQPTKKSVPAGVRVLPQERRQSLFLLGNKKPDIGAAVAAGFNYQPPTVAESHLIALILFDYVAQNPDELTLRKGTRVKVTNKDKDAQGWWSGIDENGNVGVFPYNFVKLLPQPQNSQSQPMPKQLKSSKSAGSEKLRLNGSSPLNSSSDLKAGQAPETMIDEAQYRPLKAKGGAATPPQGLIKTPSSDRLKASDSELNVLQVHALQGLPDSTLVTVKLLKQVIAELKP